MSHSNGTVALSPLFAANVSVDYRKRPGVLKSVSIDVREGEIVGLLGESGSGKSTFALATLRLLHSAEARVAGETVLSGKDLLALAERDMRTVRGREIGFVPQNPVAALNPALTLKTQFREAWNAHARDWSATGLPRVRELLAGTGLDSSDAFLQRRPNQISTGQAQRIMIAMALLHNPAMVIADEATSALDQINQRDIRQLLHQLATTRRMGMLFISHDVPGVFELCDRVSVLYQGTIVESGNAADLKTNPKHPYTRALLSAVPDWTRQ